MQRKAIDMEAWNLSPYRAWVDQGMLLTCGDFGAGDFNTMTVAWGNLGAMWNMPLAQVAVRHSRYTLEFMERYDSFTLSAFPASRRDALQRLGSTSGRDGDKIAGTGLTPAASSSVAAPCFAEADLVIECHKIYWQDIDPAHFLDGAIRKFYKEGDYHRFYFGRIIALTGRTAS